MVRRGEFVFITGPSGSGKSTLLRLLYAAEQVDAGRILFMGRDVGRLGARSIPFLRRNVGVVFQDFKLVPNWTVLQNVVLPLEVLGIPQRLMRRRVGEALERVGLGGRGADRAECLSGGEQQRTAIARALANNPKLIFADEPTGNVDSETSTQILELFNELKEEMDTSYLLCSHDPVVGEFTDRTLEIRDGILIGEHLEDIDLTDLDSSRFLVIDNQNRITLPEKALTQFHGTVLYTWEIAQEGLLLKPLAKTDRKVEQKISFDLTGKVDYLN